MKLVTKITTLKKNFLKIHMKICVIKLSWEMELAQWVSF